MPPPTISIIMPAYNSEKYLREAIDSILQQTFAGFELIIINDGSTDDTKQLINAYTDPRIVYLENDKNRGLIYTLNYGLSKANGRYIARMDADDICLPTRLEKQLRYFESRPEVAVVASTVNFINDSGKPAGIWNADRDNTTREKIKQGMAWENCIAHPSVMIRSNVAKQYRYRPGQLHAEDYDLWLRLLADGFVIEKITEPLLLYRVHETSITGSILRKSNPFIKQFRCKRNFLKHRFSLKQWGAFENKVLLTTLYDGAMGMAKDLKNAVKS
ncbi:glycosyltransferase [Segetibacter sp. 3557_3]|uniref:glycosyltransferase family 2 protein n=1 Tax=Segetibacter sp. 3557_3 TaxID=2547429 RepID=UPI001059158D|nr:glycosyltransferase [Segetibacter sp. 3557_3]TDH28846.1 glycosyltransferase [Segetibacter sp. 3557_3]